MSATEIERFVADLKATAALREEIKVKGGGPAELVEIATAHGYAITVAEVTAYIAAHKQELTDEEIDAVAGGHVPIIQAPPPPTLLKIS